MIKKTETNRYESIVFSSDYEITSETLESLGITVTILPVSSGSDYVEFSSGGSIGTLLTKMIDDRTDSLTVEFTPGTINDSVVVEVLNSTGRLARRITKGGTHLNRVVINFEPGSSNYLQLSTTGTTIKLHRILSPVGYVFKTPIMTGPTSIVPTAPWPESGWVATASDYYRESDYPAWEAFDGNKVDTSNTWHGLSDRSQWLQLQFPVKVRLLSYEITTYNSVSLYHPYKGWTVEGSMNGTNWDVLDERVENSYIKESGRTFTFHVNFPYGFYQFLRLNMNNNSSYLAIQNMNYYVQINPYFPLYFQISGGKEGTDYKTYTTSNDQLYVVFLSPQTYSITTGSSYNYEYLVVGGGGAGGGGGGNGGTFSPSAQPNTGGGAGGNGAHSYGGGGGGGGGGAVMEGTITKNAGTFDVIVGKGQTLNSGYTDFITIATVNPATDSSFDTIIAGNGGAGEYYTYSGGTISNADYSGGGGGGGGGTVGGTSVNGFSGGKSYYNSPLYFGGGGGGASQAGTDAYSSSDGDIPGVGGDGKKPTQQNIINAITYWNNNATPIGELVSNEYWFGGGGGGGSFKSDIAGGLGGKGGGTQGSPGGLTTVGLGGTGVVVLVVSESAPPTPSLISDNSNTTYYQNTDYALSSFSGTGLLSSVSHSVVLSNDDKLYSNTLGYGNDTNTLYNITNILDSNGTAFAVAEGNYPTEVYPSTNIVIIYEFATPKTITEVKALIPNRELTQGYTFTNCSIETASSTDSTYTSQGSLSGHNSSTANSVGTLTLSNNNTNVKYVKFTFTDGSNTIGVGEILIYGTSGGGGNTADYLAFAFTKPVNLEYTLMTELLINDKNGNRVMGTGAPINQTVLSNSTMFTEGELYLYGGGSIDILADGAIDTSNAGGWFQTGPHTITHAMIFYLDVRGLGINPNNLDGGSIISWTGISNEPGNNSLYSVGEVEVYVPDGTPLVGDTYSAKSGVWRKLNLTHTNVPDRGTPYPPPVIFTITGISGHFSTSASTGGPWTLDFVSHQIPYYIYRIENENTTIQYNYATQVWSDHGSDHPYDEPVRINENQVRISSNPTWPNLFTFIDPYY